MLKVAAARTAETAAAVKTDRNWTAFLLCIGLSLAWPIAMARNFAPARTRRCLWAACTWTAAVSKTQASETTQSRSARRNIRSGLARAHLAGRTSKGAALGASGSRKRFASCPRVALGVSSFQSLPQYRSTPDTERFKVFGRGSSCFERRRWSLPRATGSFRDPAFC